MKLLIYAGWLSEAAVQEYFADLPDELVGLVAPKLEQVILVGCAFRWERLWHGLLNPITPLTMLHLHDIRRTSRPTISELLAVLVAHLELKSLHLYNALQTNQSESSRAIHTLSSLSILNLSGTIEICAGFLNIIQTPSLQHLYIRVSSATASHQIPCLMSGVRQVCPTTECVSVGIGHHFRQLNIRMLTNLTNVVCWVMIPWLVLPRLRLEADFS
jgi:hypothetical protein